MKKKSLIPTPEGLTLDQIGQRFATDEKARRYFEMIRWAKGRFCPHCGNANESRIYVIKANATKSVRAGLYECAECKKQFTVTVGTIFEDSHIPLRKWLIAWYMLCASKKGISALQMQRMLGLGSYRTAWFMMHRIRYALQQPEFRTRLKGTIEADETWIGGKAVGVGPGNYRPNKTAVMSLVQRGGKVRSKVIGHVTAKNVASFITRNVHDDSRLMTDENHAYDSVGRYYKSHDKVNHGRGEYVRGDVTTNAVEGYFANLKRGLDGVYHHVSEKYLPLYLAEFDYRYNERETTDGARTNKGVKKISGKRLTLATPQKKI